MISKSLFTQVKSRLTVEVALPWTRILVGIIWAVVAEVAQVLHEDAFVGCFALELARQIARARSRCGEQVHGQFVELTLLAAGCEREIIDGLVVIFTDAQSNTKHTQFYFELSKVHTKNNFNKSLPLDAYFHPR